jgi:hypothetical protein
MLAAVQRIGLDTSGWRKDSSLRDVITTGFDLGKKSSKTTRRKNVNFVFVLADLLCHFELPFNKEIEMPDKASLERVKLLRKEYELQTRGHREQIARIVCTAFRQAKQIQKSSQKRQEFFHLVGKRPASKKKINLVTE